MLPLDDDAMITMLPERRTRPVVEVEVHGRVATVIDRRAVLEGVMLER